MCCVGAGVAVIVGGGVVAAVDVGGCGGDRCCRGVGSIGVVGWGADVDVIVVVDGVGVGVVVGVADDVGDVSNVIVFGVDGTDGVVVA